MPCVGKDQFQNMPPGSYGRFGPLVGAIDEGTSSARFLVFAAQTAEVLTYHQVEILQKCPREGWVEQDPMDILNAVNECIEKSFDNLKKLDINPADIVALGITNQRETTIVWDPLTGKPLSNAILWLDVRNTNTVDEVLSKVKNKNQNYFAPLCGLPISTYFSALKIKWLIDNVPDVKQAVEEKRCYFGTVDTWLIWNLTGGKNGGLHITDVTNASRTMLMNISTLTWDPTLCKFFDIPMHILPQIRSSSEIYGYLIDGPLEGVPISGVLGDQQSALVGQMCLKQGQAKNTYGTGCFLLYNTGTAKVLSSHGLLTTVAYRMGKTAPVIYALEGSVAVAGVAMKWLRDNLGIIQNVSETGDMVKELNWSSPGEICFVPAFSGLYAPYWRKDARSIMCGLTEDTSKELVVRATMEAVCFQTRDILEAMNKDCGIPLSKLLVDGGMTANSYMMQMQADLCGIPVVRPVMAEATALGAAMAAGSAEGINVWNLRTIQSVPSDTFHPSISENVRDMRYSKWKMAIARCLNWEPEADRKTKGLLAKHSWQMSTSLPLFSCGHDKQESIHSSIPASIFLLSSFGLLLLAEKLNSL